MLADLLIQAADGRMPAVTLALVLVAVSGGVALAICILFARRIQAIGERSQVVEPEAAPKERPVATSD